MFINVFFVLSSSFEFKFCEEKNLISSVHGSILSAQYRVWQVAVVPECVREWMRFAVTY